MGDIEFRNLSFSYNGHAILKNINLHIPAGKTVAVVGATGSGKSTLVSLIPRLYDAPPGTLLIDGVPIRQIPLQTLRKDIGFVPQETFLFSETIRENIRLGAPDRPPMPRWSAPRKFPIFSRRLTAFPKKFDTMVGERGLTLSGGQKQRTAISRAVIRDPAHSDSRRCAFQRRYLHRGDHSAATHRRHGGPHDNFDFASRLNHPERR